MLQTEIESDNSIYARSYIKRETSIDLLPVLSGYKNILNGNRWVSEAHDHQ
jgi:hypothetical protein